MKRVFLSFASEDMDFVLRLFTRLKQQDIEIWDYSDRNQEIALGQHISTALAQQIQLADYFLPVVSRNSVDIAKWYTHYEVKIALTYSKPVYPILLEQRPPESWQGKYKHIQGIRYLIMNHQNDTDFEAKICTLCSYLDVRYRPPENDPYLLPLFKNFEKELDTHLSEVKELHNKSLYEELVTTINKFNLFYSTGDWKNAHKTICYLITTLEFKTENAAFYYVTVVKGTCELQLGRWQEAEQTFQKAGELPDADENAFGGLGNVYYSQQQYSKALKSYQKALDRCPEEQKTELHYNILLTAVEVLNSTARRVVEDKDLMLTARCIVEDTNWWNRLDLELYSPRDQVRIQHLFAVARLKQEKIREAFELMQKIYNYRLAVLPASFLKDLSTGFITPALFGALITAGIHIPKNAPVHGCDTKDSKHFEMYVVTDGISSYVFATRDNELSVYYREVAILIDYGDLLDCLGYSEEAIVILTKEAAALNDRSLFQRLAFILAKCGRKDAAREIYHNKLCTEPFERQYLVEYALFVKQLGKTQETEEVCRQVISLGNPQSFSDWYYQGFAHYLLGDAVNAKLYYNGCKNYDKYYDQMAI